MAAIANLIPTPPHSLLHYSQHYTTSNSSSLSHNLSPGLKLSIKAKPSAKFTVLCSSSVIEEDSAQAGITTEDAGNIRVRGCKACGRVEIERGCNGEGRIQGGIATFPGFGWWPIKAYRPCPGLVESGGRYTRRGQSMDEVTSGTSRREKLVETMTLEEMQSRKKK